MAHKHKWSGWYAVDTERVLLFRACACRAVEFSAGEAFRQWRKRTEVIQW